MFRTRPASVGAVLPDPIENNARCSAALMEDSLLKHIFLTSMFAAAIALPAFARRLHHHGAGRSRRWLGPDRARCGR